MKVKYLQWNDRIIAFLFSKTIRSLNKSCVKYMYLQEMFNDICSNHDPGGFVGATMSDDQISTLKFICTYINDIICYSSMHTS